MLNYIYPFEEGKKPHFVLCINESRNNKVQRLEECFLCVMGFLFLFLNFHLCYVQFVIIHVSCIFFANVDQYNAGYFSNEEATASTLDSEGWLRTGDLCYIDEDGFIFVVDRLKELIKYKGYQVKEQRCCILISSIYVSSIISFSSYHQEHAAMQILWF